MFHQVSGRFRRDKADVVGKLDRVRPRVVSDEQLLDLLLDAFADLGYEGTSIRQLCRHLGMSHNLIHQRYESKEKAWYAAIDHGFESLTSEIVAVPEGASTDELTVLRAAMQQFVRATMKRPALVRIIQQEASRPGPRFSYMFERYIGPIQTTLVAEVLRSLQEQGRIRDGDVQTVYFFLTTWGLGGLASVPLDSVQLGGTETDREALAALAVDVLIDGIMRPQ